MHPEPPHPEHAVWCEGEHSSLCISGSTTACLTAVMIPYLLLLAMQAKAVNASGDISAESGVTQFTTLYP